MTMHFIFYLVERHRKKKINAGINRIGELIPCSPALKQVSGHLNVHSYLPNGVHLVLVLSSCKYIGILLASDFMLEAQ